MKIDGLKPTFVPALPNILKNKLEFRTTTNLSENDTIAFAKALIKLEELIVEECVNIDNVPRAFAIFTDQGDLKISLDKGTLGTNVHLICYAIQRWEEYNLSEVHKVSVFLEELCHWFWNIDDEVKVKFKVFEILKRIYATVKFEEVFNLKGLQ